MFNGAPFPIIHYFHRAKKGPIQYGYRKCETHAGVCSQTLEPGKNEQDKKKQEGKKRGASMERSKAGADTSLHRNAFIT